MAALITADQIANICGCPVSNLSPYIPFLDESLRRFAINTPQRMAAFFANVGEESSNFKRTLEYADGKAYEGRKDLGNIIPGDGPLYRGRGLIQITGRTNYRACSKALYGNDSLITAPSILESPKGALLSAAWFWSDRQLNQIADEPESWLRDSYTKIQYIRRRINGGLNDIAKVEASYNRARSLFKF